MSQAVKKTLNTVPIGRNVTFLGLGFLICKMGFALDDPRNLMKLQ